MSFLVNAQAVGGKLSKKLQAVYRSGDWKSELQNIESELSEEMDVQEEDDEIYQKRFKSYLKDLEKNLLEEGTKIHLFRALNIEDFPKWLQNIRKGYEDIDKYGAFDEESSARKIGDSWSYKKKGAVAYWGNAGKTYIIEALVPISAVDFYSTVALAVTGETHEAEIRLKDHEEIILLNAFPKRGAAMDLKKIKAKT